MTHTHYFKQAGRVTVDGKVAIRWQCQGCPYSYKQIM